MLQQWRMKKAAAFIPAQSRLLDIGCHKGELLLLVQHRIESGVGIDPLCDTSMLASHIQLLQGSFPQALASMPPFGVITALALVEHIPAKQQQTFFDACFQWLLPGGLLICTIPHKKVDRVLEILTSMKLIKGMSLEQHHGFEVSDTTVLASNAGFRLVRHSRFQLGLNNLFVFQKPGQ
jgi:cyclopropane fatty-acyl-phospholipid synthase-like methyltransferase